MGDSMTYQQDSLKYWISFTKTYTYKIWRSQQLSPFVLSLSTPTKSYNMWNVNENQSGVCALISLVVNSP